jgi:hypothetical protein
MSDANDDDGRPPLLDSHEGEPEPVRQELRQEEDAVAALPVVLVMLAAVAMVVIGVVWPWLIVGRTTGRAPEVVPGSAPRAHEPLPRLVGGLARNLGTDQVRDFERGATLSEGGAEVPEPPPPLGPSVDRFEWVDRAKGMVKVPVDVAAELWLEREARSRGERSDDSAQKGGTP